MKNQAQRNQVIFRGNCNMVDIAGYVYAAASAFSMFLGAVLLFRAKENSEHKRQGRWKIYVILVTNLMALAIY